MLNELKALVSRYYDEGGVYTVEDLADGLIFHPRTKDTATCIASTILNKLYDTEYPEYFSLRLILDDAPTITIILDE
ncbi:MAG: hypothetical protein II661_04580 [Bacteroidales bacterium]|nr:hypothetical protein [Bacteroidales bacterium]